MNSSFDCTCMDNVVDNIAAALDTSYIALSTQVLVSRCNDTCHLSLSSSSLSDASLLALFSDCSTLPKARYYSLLTMGIESISGNNCTTKLYFLPGGLTDSESQVPTGTTMIAIMSFATLVIVLLCVMVLTNTGVHIWEHELSDTRSQVA